MDIYDITQITLVLSAGLVFARMGMAIARRIERRPDPDARLTAAAEDRLRSLEGESSIMRQELTELHERQDFTERMLQAKSEPPRPVRGERPEERVVTPH